MPDADARRLCLLFEEWLDSPPAPPPPPPPPPPPQPPQPPPQEQQPSRQPQPSWWWRRVWGSSLATLSTQVVWVLCRVSSPPAPPPPPAPPAPPQDRLMVAYGKILDRCVAGIVASLGGANPIPNPNPDPRPNPNPALAQP